MADTPVINGNMYGWASVEPAIDGVAAPKVTEITYSASMEPGDVRATGTRIMGTTDGEASAEGSLTMLKGEASAWIKRMGHGFMKRKFPITVSFDEDGEGGIVTDELIGVRIKKVEDNPKVGNEPLTTKFDLHIMRMKLNSVDPHGTENEG